MLIFHDDYYSLFDSLSISALLSNVPHCIREAGHTSFDFDTRNNMNRYFQWTLLYCFFFFNGVIIKQQIKKNQLHRITRTTTVIWSAGGKNKVCLVFGSVPCVKFDCNKTNTEKRLRATAVRLKVDLYFERAKKKHYLFYIILCKTLKALTSV